MVFEDALRCALDLDWTSTELVIILEFLCQILDMVFGDALGYILDLNWTRPDFTEPFLW